jgi:hypothetical protein
MDNYYNSSSPQEKRYRDVLEAIGELGSTASELAEELDHVVWQVVNRAVDVAIAEHDREMLKTVSGARLQASRLEAIARSRALPLFKEPVPGAVVDLEQLPAASSTPSIMDGIVGDRHENDELLGSGLSLDSVGATRR